MTNDFKKKLLDWLSGNYQVESGSNVPQFSEVSNEYNNLQERLDTTFPYGFSITGSLQSYSINGDGLKYTIAYGEYFTASYDSKGFIMILDEDFTLLQCITSYSSGTQFAIFEIMNVGDDGNFFAIENTGTSKRFVMMNNIIAKLPTEENYKVVLKKSYTLQGASANISDYLYKLLIKAPGQSRYIIGGMGDDGLTNVVSEFVINVGASNEWNDYTYDPGDNFFEMYDIYANWNTQGNVSFKVVGFYTDSIDDENIVIKYASLNGTSNNVGTMTLVTYNYQLPFDFLYGADIKIINDNEVYFIVSYTTQEDYGSYRYIEIIHYKNGNSQRVYYRKTVYSDVHLYKINNEVFYLIQYVDNSDNYVLEFGKIIDNDYYSKIVRTSEEVIDYMFFTIQKQFNLYDYYIQFENSVDIINQIYSPNDYNGTEYQALNSMVPGSAELLSYQVPIFARDLYNRIINNNTTISILNVPNSYVNGVDISQQRLYGETKTMLVENNDIYTTNVYEEVLFNFVNTLLMKNENDLTNIIDNLAGAIRLNKSISSLLDYNNCKIAKYKINYNDNTSTIIPLTSGNITFQASKTVYTISFYNENIKNIQLISADESTVYQTIDISELDTGKYYVINQDLHIV